MKVLKAIADRRSIRNFESTAVPDEDILSIVHAGQCAPTARNNKAVEFIIIKDELIKHKLYDIFAKLAPQDFVKEAPVLIMPISDTSKANLSDFDLATASQNMMIQSSSLGLGSVWKHIRPPLVEEIRSLLEIPAHFSFCNLIVIGHPKEENRPAPYHEMDFDPKKIHTNRY
jgi:nitroreductase